VPAMGAIVASVVLVAAACSGGEADSSGTTAAESGPATCPNSSRANWQALANEINAPVYCPSWLPSPLVGRFRGRFFNGRYVDADRSYLVSFVWFETGGGVVNEVHVNLRAYPGKTAIPTCEDLNNVAGKVVKKKIPCFSDPQAAKKRFGSTTATVYTANQGVDSWHVLYAWRDRGSLYTLSEHVAAPYTYDQVIANLDKMMRGLVLIEPTTA
jgi:hypothetical protein